MDLTSSFTINTVAKALDGLSMRHTAIASNIANVDTPGYHSKSVSFESDLKRAIQQKRNPKGESQASNEEALPLRQVNPLHYSPNPLEMTLQDVNPTVHETSGMSYRNDGSSVDIEGEMVALAKNTERFKALSEMEKRMIEGIKRVIQSGGE
jgi:flagellar basal-body rod protein FlgB